MISSSDKRGTVVKNITKRHNPYKENKHGYVQNNYTTNFYVQRKNNNTNKDKRRVGNSR